MTPAQWQIAGLAGLALILIVTATSILFQIRHNPERKERRRRLAVNRTGRLGDGVITDFTEDTLFYTYSIRGVVYTASQDIGTLRELLPPDPRGLIGHVTLKYASNNPANSILFCEEWSGLRAAPASVSSTNASKELNVP